LKVSVSSANKYQTSQSRGRPVKCLAMASKPSFYLSLGLGTVLNVGLVLMGLVLGLEFPVLGLDSCGSSPWP